MLIGPSAQFSTLQIQKVVQNLKGVDGQNNAIDPQSNESLAMAFSSTLQAAAEKGQSPSFDVQLKALGRDHDDLGVAMSDWLKVQLDPDSPESIAIRNGPRAEQARMVLESNPKETADLVFKVLDQVAPEDTNHRADLLRYYRNLNFGEAGTTEATEVVHQWQKSQDWADPKRRYELTLVTDAIRNGSQVLAQQSIHELRERYSGNREMTDYLNSQFSDILPAPNSMPANAVPMNGTDTEH